MIRVITIDKKWKTKTGEELKDNSLKATISILAKFDNIAPIKEEHNFDTKTPSNTYYVSSVATGISIGENGVELKDGEEAEVKIGNRTFIATLKEISKEHYEVTNREKSDKPVKPNSTKVKFSKRDIAGKELKDATIRLTHADGTSEEWKSDGTVKEFTVKEGKYTFKETAGSGWIPGIYRNYI